MRCLSCYAKGQRTPGIHLDEDFCLLLTLGWREQLGGIELAFSLSRGAPIYYVYHFPLLLNRPHLDAKNHAYMRAESRSKPAEELMVWRSTNRNAYISPFTKSCQIVRMLEILRRLEESQHLYINCNFSLSNSPGDKDKVRVRQIVCRGKGIRRERGRQTGRQT